MRDWEPKDPRKAKRMRIEASVLIAALAFIAGANLLMWIKGLLD